MSLIDYKKPEQFDLWFGQEPLAKYLPSQIKRKIIHIDMDAFYAAVEEREDPSLKNVPLVIGGSPESRAVVCTANYKARKFGIRSAMPCSKAARLCANAVFMPPRFELYSQVSEEIHEIFYRYTSLVQPLSLDEAFLDVTDCEFAPSATEIAQRIKNDIFAKTKLTASAGVAINKMLAKIASDVNKPNGICVIKPEHTRTFIKNLEIKKIPGIGPVTSQNLADIGIKVCSDVWQTDIKILEEKMGKRFAKWLIPLSYGIDNRPVEVERKRKSFSFENTYNQDLITESAIKSQIQELCQQLCKDLQSNSISGKTVNFKLRYNDFHTITRSRSINHFTNNYSEIITIVMEMFNACYENKRPVRLLGVGLSKLSDQDEQDDQGFDF